MPKLIIKRELPQRFTWQAILFWVLGLVPVALLAGFLTGNLISQWQHPYSGQMPLVPLTPVVQAEPLPPSSSANLSVPLTTALPNDTNLEQTTSSATTSIKPLIQSPVEKPKSLNQSLSTEPSTPAKTNKKPAETNTHKGKPSPSINQANTKNQQNNRNRPVESPRSINKPVKSPQTVSESPRPNRSVARATPERSVQTAATPPKTTKNERGNTNDYRLLEQSLGIPLQ